MVQDISDVETKLESNTTRFSPIPASAISYQVTQFAAGLEVPWGIVFTSPERMLVTERPGRVRAIIAGNVQATPVLTIPDVSNSDEEGLMGIVLDPDYQTNRWLYLCYAYQNSAGLATKVVRAFDQNSTLKIDKTLITDIPAARFHAGCALGFGPDNKLYISTGDATQKEMAQDLNSLAGKILRLNADGTIPNDNPFPNSAIWSYGHRNPQGLAWGTAGTLYSVEHGPSGFDGPGGGDELNVITKGGNYGWPLVSHLEERAGTMAPKIVYTPAVAPATAAVYVGDAFPDFAHNLFFTTLKGEALVRVVLDPDNPAEVIQYEKMPNIDFGRLRAIVVGPDGFLYFSTSNRDGRGQTRTGDDKIFVITPQ